LDVALAFMQYTAQENPRCREIRRNLRGPAQQRLGVAQMFLVMKIHAAEPAHRVDIVGIVLECIAKALNRFILASRLEMVGTCRYDALCRVSFEILLESRIRI